MNVGLIVALVSLLLASPVQKQEDEEARAWRLVSEYYDTVVLYRQGQIDAALERLKAVTAADQLSIAGRAVLIVEAKQREMAAPARGERPPTNTAPASALRWTIDIFPAAGALHMEAAIASTRLRTDSGYHAASEQVLLAEPWFDKYIELTRKEPRENPARRWKLVIGLMTMSHGAFGRAVSLLDAECAKAPDDPALQIACGSAQEALAMSPGDLALATSRTSAKLATEREIFDDSKLTGAKSVESPVGSARGFREGHLKRAERAFEMAIKADPRNVEARIRLGNVLAMRGDDAKASGILEPLLLESVGAREAYLSRLLLSRVQIRARQFDEAARVLEQAAKAMPSGQSAYVGLANIETQRANAKAAAEALQRMLTAPQTPDDPWVTYRLAQYWVPDTLVRELRAEARQ